jgi:hypothetical protein
MIQMQPSQVVITTPKDTVIVARPLYERLEARMQPDDLGLLHRYDWWVQLSELIAGIQIDTSAPPRSA